MAFDTPTRNRLNAFVGDARRLITREFTEKFRSLYGISAEGGIADLAALGHLDEAGLATAALLRARIDYLVRSQPDNKGDVAVAIDRVAREQAFTTLNRLAAVRMAEKRGLITESVGAGYKSKGFQVFERVAGSSLGDTYLRYRRYLFCLFDELAVDLGALFDRRSPQGLLFPREPALLALLELVNAPDLENLWAEDETIGWIYQYYNDEAERKKMREESSAPRNSRELAVRNQFFTPRYVVEFLTDNTLGRTWYEMTAGQTVLKEQCRYLVRRPTEIFLKPGDSAPEEAKSADNLSQEELLQQPVRIPHRPLKDPREIRLLDPACGSMHFGLYAFDLFTVIYDEAWEVAHGSDYAAKSAETVAPFVSFASNFPDKAAFLREVPRLIVEYNLHGIDIDPRAAQIAGLSLWLRAQRAWYQAGVKPADRPRITRSNLVCAEPMPGEKELLREFVEQQFPAGERPTFAFLLETVFDRMTLAGEAGSLLRIEEEIRAAIAEAKRLWKAGPKHEQATLFPEAGARLGQGEMRLDLSGITDEQFWERAEQRIYNALEAYAEQAENGGGFQRRLFADDAAQGFAFIDLCRKRYDVVVMNPPFGSASVTVGDYLVKKAEPWCNNLAAAFLLRAKSFGSVEGKCGVICDKTIVMKSSYEPFRIAGLLDDFRPVTFADLGWEVLDYANVEVVALTLHRHSSKSSYARIWCCDCRTAENKAQALQMSLAGSRGAKLIAADWIRKLPNSSFAYDLPHHVFEIFREFSPMCEAGARALQGHAIKMDWYGRLVWEISPSGLATEKWCRMYNGGNYSTYYMPLVEVVLWNGDGTFLKHHKSTRWSNATFQRRPGIGYGKRGDILDAHILPSGFVFTVEGLAAIPGSLDSAWLFLAILNSPVATKLINFYCGQHKHAGYVDLLPIPAIDANNADQQVASREAQSAWHEKRRLDRINEISPIFCAPLHKGAVGERFNEIGLLRAKIAKNEALANAAVSRLYGLSAQDLEAIHSEEGDNKESENDSDGQTDENQSLSIFAADQFRCIASYAIGALYGRWDIRYATGEQLGPELPDPFAPLPVCPPGMLQGDDGLPLSPEAGRRLRTAGRYPLDVAWDGILVDDPEHPLDLERRVHSALAVLWGDRAEALEHEACALLGVSTIREWFRRPAGFFADHLKRYSKSRRQAPIYWPLSTASGSYSLWIYYHRLTDQTLHNAIADFIDPKLRSSDREISAQQEKPGGGGSKVAELLEFHGELLDLKAELERIIKLPWKPNLNDGVLITACPLWKLFRLPKWQKDLRSCWQELEKGDYDWAHLAYSIWPKRVEKVCETDRSIAIAHGLEHLCKVEPPKPKKERKARQPKAETPDGLLEGLEEVGTAAKAAPRSSPSEISITPRNATPSQEAPLAGDASKIDIEDTDRSDVMCRIRQLFGEGGARDRETALKQLSLSLGYQRLGTKVREILERDLLTAVRRGILINNGGHLQLATGGLDAVDRDELKDGFLAAIGRSWIDREEAVRCFARFLGYARTGPVLEDTARSLMNGLIRDGRLESDGPNLRRT
jgi:hypothetical protein